MNSASTILVGSQFTGTSIALQTSQRSWSFDELRAAVASLAGALHSSSGFVGVYTGEATTTVIGLLAALAAGKTFVRLNPSDPRARTEAILRLCPCAVLLADETSLDSRLVERARREGTVVRNVSQVLKGSPRSDALEPTAVRADDLAYIHFTSGEGDPLGVRVSHGNLKASLAALVGRFGSGFHDRFLCLANPASDLFLVEALLAWRSGARVCCPSRAESMLPVEFARAHGVTFWPLPTSQAAFLSSVGALEPGLFPSLRRTVFVGGVLSEDLARTWSAAAPHSLIDTLYGPVETTGVCASHRWHPSDPSYERNGKRVPLGSLFPGVEGRVVDGRGCPVAAGEAGELVVCAPQVTSGYWGRTEATVGAFLKLEGHEDHYFRTGDRVRIAVDGALLHEGRLDRQLRVRGFRVGLGEVEHQLRRVTGRSAVVVIGWPSGIDSVDELIGFVESAPIDLKHVKRELRTRLPRYMVPNRILVLPRLPRTGTGAIDMSELVLLGSALAAPRRGGASVSTTQLS